MKVKNKVKSQAIKSVNKVKIEVDQSGKIEDTSINTIIAFSNGITHSIKISKQTKREYIKLSRKLGKTGKTFYLQFFSAGLFLLIEKYINKSSSIVIDLEYVSKDNDIRRFVTNYFSKKNIKFNHKLLEFQRIGKKSNAHVIAIACTRGDKKPDKTINLDQILNLTMTSEERKKIGGSLRR